MQNNNNKNILTNSVNGKIENPSFFKKLGIEIINSNFKILSPNLKKDNYLISPIITKNLIINNNINTNNKSINNGNGNHNNLQNNSLTAQHNNSFLNGKFVL